MNYVYEFRLQTANKQLHVELFQSLTNEQIKICICLQLKVKNMNSKQDSYENKMKNRELL
jgi:hypothetical protein